MSIFDFVFKKDKQEVVEEKSSGNDFGLGQFSSYVFSQFGYSIGHIYLSPQLAYTFYNKISPLKGAIQKVALAIGDLPMVMRSESEPDIITKDGKIIELLKNPSPLTTKKQFLMQSAISVMLTNELFIVARGGRNAPPVELVFVHPYNIQITEDANSIFPVQIYVNLNGDRRYYYRELYKGRYRYFDRSGLNEIYPYISERSSSNESGFFRGISPLTSLKDEMIGYSASVISNKEAVENSGKPSGVISLDDDTLTEEQRKDLKQSIIEAGSGIQNSGNVLMIPAKVSAVFPQWSPRDMDYEVMQKNMKHNLWRLYSIPLPIVSEDGQTYSNFAEAQTAFYDEAVNQVWSLLADAFGWILETRFDMKDQFVSYNQFEVPALRARQIQRMADMMKTEVIELNEIRSSGGYEDVKDGDNILISSNKSTLDSVINSADYSAAVRTNPNVPKPNAKKPPKE
jgi:HK97 family phage portal protein